MDELEYKSNQERINRYSALDKIRNEIWEAIREIRMCENSSPFTGDWRESRRVKSIAIQFTKTRGGQGEVEAKIENLHIEASDLGRAIQGLLEAKIKTLDAEIAKI